MLDGGLVNSATWLVTTVSYEPSKESEYGKVNIQVCADVNLELGAEKDFAQKMLQVSVASLCAGRETCTQACFLLPVYTGSQNLEERKQPLLRSSLTNHSVRHTGRRLWERCQGRRCFTVLGLGTRRDVLSPSQNPVL